MSQGNKSVLVLDSTGVIAEYVEPAVARRALKEGAARKVKVKPFTLQMREGLRRLPRLFGSRSSSTMSTNSLDKFGELFAEEQPLWVKTLVPGQVSFEIQVAAGMTMPIRVPANGDPVCLTDVADFQSLKRCTDLRKLASPRETRDNKTGQRGLKPPAIKILTEDEMRAHLEQKATRRGWFKEDGTPDIERAMQPQYTEGAMPAPATRVELPPSQTKELSESQGADANLGQDGQVVMAEVIHPRVLAICNEISDPNLPENQRISADQILDEFETLGSMNPESLNHILAYGYYKSVKKWAAEQLKEAAE